MRKFIEKGRRVHIPPKHYLWYALLFLVFIFLMLFIYGRYVYLTKVV